MIAQITSGANAIRPAKFITKTIPQGIYSPRSIIKGSFTPAFISFRMKHFATFPVSFPILSSAYSCIVCLHQAAPQKPSLTLWGLVFGLIYRHQSLFVWMSYGLTLLVCSFCGDYKDLYSDWEASSTLSHSHFFVRSKLWRGGSLHSKHPDLPITPLTPHNCKPANPSGPPWHLNKVKQKVLWPKQGFYCWTWNMYLSLLFIVCIFFWNNASENPHFLCL